MPKSNYKTRKVALIGTGAVGTSFIYSAINTGLAQEYLLIDLNKEFAEGQALDLEDAGAYSTSKFTKIVAGDYKDLKEIDLIVITAGRPQKDGETRLDMVADNAKIMKGIAEQVVKSGFNGITLIASNPVDVMTPVYQKVTGFDEGKVISSGTSLDSSRLRVELSKVLEVNSGAIKAYVVGEHGDSSVSTFFAGKVGLSSLTELAKSKNIDQKQLDQIHESV
jgi:L-lactate dehydrogenase